MPLLVQGGSGGAPGSTSPLYKGAFATLALLTTAFPTGSVGEFAYVGPDKYEWNPASTSWVSPILALTAEPNETILDGEYVNAAYRQWLNDSGGDLVVPALITAANMEAAGFTDVTAGVTVSKLVDADTDILTDGADALVERS